MTTIKTLTLSETDSKRGSLMVQRTKSQIISQFSTREVNEVQISVFPDIDKPEGLHLVIEDPAEVDRLIQALKDIRVTTWGVKNA